MMEGEGMNKRQEKKLFVSLVTNIVASNIDGHIPSPTRAERRVLRKHLEIVYLAAKLIKEKM